MDMSDRFSLHIDFQKESQCVIVCQQVNNGLNMVAVLPIFLFFIIDGTNGGCDEFVPKGPNLKQIYEDLVLVEWVEAAASIHKLDMIGVKLNYWPFENPNRTRSIEVTDLDINFDFATVEKGVIFSYQIIFHVQGKGFVGKKYIYIYIYVFRLRLLDINLYLDFKFAFL